MIEEATSPPSFIPVAVNDSRGKALGLSCSASQMPPLSRYSQELELFWCSEWIRTWECSSSAAVSQLSPHKQLQGRMIEAWERICRCQFASWDKEFM